MINVSEDILGEFLEACHAAAGRGLMRCSSGNISRRLDDERLLATASRSWAENLSGDEVSVCRVAYGAIRNHHRQIQIPLTGKNLDLLGLL